MCVELKMELKRVCREGGTVTYTQIPSGEPFSMERDLSCDRCRKSTVHDVSRNVRRGEDDDKV